MTVLLKGMEMPENCSNCVFSIPQIPANITHAWLGQIEEAMI